MKYLLKGEQRDGEHEYRIFSVMQVEKAHPTNDEAERFLVQRHAFGYTEDDDNTPIDDLFNYGDGLTAICLCSVDEITEEDFNVLERLRII